MNSPCSQTGSVRVVSLWSTLANPDTAFWARRVKVRILCNQICCHTSRWWVLASGFPSYLSTVVVGHCFTVYSAEWDEINNDSRKETIVVVCWLLNVPAVCLCISGTDLLRQLHKLPHRDRSCRLNFLPHPVTVYWHKASQSQRWPYNARRLARQPLECHCLSHWYDSTPENPRGACGNRTPGQPLSRRRLTH